VLAGGRASFRAAAGGHPSGDRGPPKPGRPGRSAAVAVRSRPPRGPRGWHNRRSADARAPHGLARRKQQTPRPAAQ